jgi:hypothetical protein
MRTAWARVAMSGWLMAGFGYSCSLNAHSGEANGAAAHYRLVLADAMGQGKDLVLYVARRDGRIAHAFARAPRFNRMPYLVGTNGLSWVGADLAGVLDFVVPSDGYVPKPGETLRVALRLAASEKDGALAGTYEGTVRELAAKGVIEGARVGRQAGPALSVRLACEGAVFPSSGKKGGRVGMNLSFREDRCVAARLIPPGSITDVAFSVKTVEQSLRLDGEVLSGTLLAHVSPQSDGQKAIPHAYRIEGLVIGDSAAGTLKVSEDGGVASDGQFLGEARGGVAAPGDALYTVSLQGAIPPHNFLVLYLAASGGAFVQGFAASPNFNNATHSVDLANLRLEPDGRIHGEVAVTVHPDPWIPKDHRPVAGVYTLDGVARDHAVTGQFTGRFGGAEARGAIEGNLEPRPAELPVASVTLKLENALFGGTDWHNRAFVSVNFADGQVAGGGVGNNHTKLKGTVTGGDLAATPDRLKGRVTARIEPGGGVTEGDYTFELDAQRVGTVGAGSFTAHGPGGRTKTGRFWTALKLAEPAVAR